MKIVAILGSPKRKGNTAKVLSMFEDKVSKEHEVEIININDYKVNGCIGCYKCKEKTDEPGCVQNDDASTIFDKLMQADAIIYATPLYCWSFSSQMKPLIDRHLCLVTGFDTPDHKSLISGKSAALLVTCEGPIEGNCDFIQGIFDGCIEYCKMASKGKFILPHCSTLDAIGANGQKLAENLAKAITENSAIAG